MTTRRYGHFNVVIRGIACGCRKVFSDARRKVFSDARRKVFGDSRRKIFSHARCGRSVVTCEHHQNYALPCSLQSYPVGSCPCPSSLFHVQDAN